jgi:HrpA-like RNA helicase
MLITQIAEMRRSAIHELCLHAKMFAPSGMNVRRFLDHAPEPPSPQAIDKSLEFLEQLGALFTYEKSFELPSNVADSYHQNKAQQSDPKLTTLGRLIANLPLDPQLARLLLFGVAMKVLQPVLTLVAALAHRDPFTLPSGDDKMVCIMARDKFSKLDYSDHLMLLRVLNAYCDIHPSYTSTFCRQNFLSKPAIIMILGIRRQLFMELKRLHIVPSSANSFEDPELNQFSTSWPMIQGVLVAGSYPGIAFIRSGSKLRKIHPINCSSSGSTSASLASLHPSSSLRRQVQNNKRSDFLNECLVNDVEPIIESVVFQELSKIEEGLTV